MKYRLEYDCGQQEFEAKHDVEAQHLAREFLTKNMLLPQRRKNYLFRHTFYQRTWNVLRAFWRWDDISI
jgi:ribosome-associated toxin RatA of RatAB toxin-antitoxin module